VFASVPVFVAAGICGMEGSVDRAWRDKLQRAEALHAKTLGELRTARSQRQETYEVVEDMRRLWLSQCPSFRSPDENGQRYWEAVDRDGGDSAAVREMHDRLRWAEIQAEGYVPDPHNVQQRFGRIQQAIWGGR
jgi:hypothetical protein